MYDIEALEKEWKQYNRRKKRPWYFFSALVFTILILSLFLYKNNFFQFDNSIASTLDKKNVHPDVDTKVNTLVLLDGKLSELLIESTGEIQKDIPENKTIAKTKSKNKVDFPAMPIVNNIPIIDKVPVGKIIVSDKPKMTIETKPMIVVKELPRKKMHLNVIESSSVSAYSDVEKRFHQSHDTDDSLFLAKSYYRKGNYRKAEYWALQTNKVNNSLEESWLIYVQAKSKLGHKNEAIRILTNYARRSNSSAAWNLLLKLKK